MTDDVKASWNDPAAPGVTDPAFGGPDTTISLRPGPDDPPEIGRRLSIQDQDAVDAVPIGSAMLVVHRGPNAGARFLLDSDLTTVGRHPGSDIFLDDVTVSRRHAEFVRRQGRFVVRDVGSLNGTYVGSAPINEAELGHLDEVRIGKFRMVVYMGRPGSTS